MKDFYGLIILDGFGYSSEVHCNAIAASGTPFITSLMHKYPHTLIGASGFDVGLPDGQMGNSEVGHLNIGAGRVVYQELTKVTKSIKDGDFFTNSVFMKAIANAKKGKKLHIMGLLSNGGVHSHIDHIKAILKLANIEGLKDVFIHCFMDGRDVSPTSGINFIDEIEKEMKTIECGKIATISGRYYAMDRDNNWDRVARAYSAIVDGEGKCFESANECMTHNYGGGKTDEFIFPSIICDGGVPISTIDKGDSVIFMNFRPDRAREITRAFISPEFDKFERAKGFLDLEFVSLTQYDVTFEGLRVAYTPISMNNTLGEYLSNEGKSQLRIAETEKYAHVTFFFNGGVEAPNPNEDRILVKSPNVATYDLKPEMSAYEVTEKAIEAIKSGKYDFMVLNFANCDMVGHTGIMDATVSAVNAVDKCVEQVIETIMSTGGKAIITADHGNADRMCEADGSPFTAHTTNPVPLIVIDSRVHDLRMDGKLADIAPTLLDMMDMAKPIEMTGKSLLIKK